MNRIVWIFIFFSIITMNSSAQKSAIVKNVSKNIVKSEDKKLVKARKLISARNNNLLEPAISRTFKEGDRLLKSELTDSESKILVSLLKKDYGDILDITPAFAKQLYQICVMKGKKSYEELFDIMYEYKKYAKLKIGKNNILKLEKMPDEIMDVNLTPNLSLNKWFHIYLGHGERINKNKTYFAKEFIAKLPEEIESIAKNEAYYIGQQKKNGNKLYYKHFDECIGYDYEGNKLDYIMVVTYGNGKICSSYPITESKLKKLAKLNSR